MRLLLATLVLAAALGTSAAAAPCQSTGDSKARGILIPSAQKDMMGFSAWSWLIADRLDSVQADRTETCSRGAFRVGSQILNMSGDNGEAYPRKAVSEAPDGPVVMLVPFDVKRMRNAFPGLAPGGKTPFYLIVVADEGVLTVERVVQGIPSDAVLIGEFGLALSKANTMARRAPGDAQAGIVLRGPADQPHR